MVQALISDCRLLESVEYRASPVIRGAQDFHTRGCIHHNISRPYVAPQAMTGAKGLPWNGHISGALEGWDDTGRRQRGLRDSSRDPLHGTTMTTSLELCAKQLAKSISGEAFT